MNPLNTRSQDNVTADCTYLPREATVTWQELIKKGLQVQHIKLISSQLIKGNGLTAASKHKALLDCGL